MKRINIHVCFVSSPTGGVVLSCFVTCVEVYSQTRRHKWSVPYITLCNLKAELNPLNI